MDDSNQSVDDNGVKNSTQCMKRRCSCRQLMNDCDMNMNMTMNMTMDMNNENSSISELYNFTTPIWSEACGGFDILERPYTEENDTQETLNPSKIMAQTSEVWKNCSCTWPLDTASRKFPCCVLNWFEIVNKQNPNDWESLAVEYITAELNLLNGVDPYESLSADLNATLDLLAICPQNWTTVVTESATALKSRLLEFNQGGTWSTSLTPRITSSNEASRVGITTTQTSKTFLLFVIIPTVLSVAIIVLVGAIIFLNRPKHVSDSQSTNNETTNNI